MSEAGPIAFAGGTLDRVDAWRSDPARLAAAWAHARAQLLLLDGLDPLVAEGGVLATAPLQTGLSLEDHALLGLREDGTPVFIALHISEPSEPSGFPPKVWQVALALEPAELAIYAAARSLVDWHARHNFCAKCGHMTAPMKAGWARLCPNCGTEHFPRVDPVVIMLAEFEGKVLLGRNARFPPRRFSALAGFVEPGETIEEAVRRELFEEAGVRIGRVDYVMSQPWPFPSQLMIACHAYALSGDLVVDEKELVEAMWVSRDDVRAAFAEDEDALFLPPSPIAVARVMLRRWLDAGA